MVQIISMDLRICQMLSMPLMIWLPSDWLIGSELGVRVPEDVAVVGVDNNQWTTVTSPRDLVPCPLWAKEAQTCYRAVVKTDSGDEHDRLRTHPI